MGNHAESEKAQRYIVQLDEARCAGRWNDVPELCRKVEKHAPHRQCLTKTARSEAQIAKFSTQRPSTAASTASSGLSNIIPALLTAIDGEGERDQDAFQATVCLAWLHYVLDEPGLAIARLPSDLAAVATTMEEATPTSWTRVCLVKGAFLRGSSLEKTGAVEEAVASYSSAVPWLSSRSIASETHQFKMWTEHLLVRLCHLSDQSSDVGEYTDLSDALQFFRFWARYWDVAAKGTGTEGANAAKYRRLAWKAYYDTLSLVLHHDVPYEPEQPQADDTREKAPAGSHPRLQQRAELKKVEAIYESLFLKETEFPKASESNTEIEQWVDAAIDNWRILCGPTWTDADLGAGGKEAVGRCMLDILYRAATKTFHSTQILRHLFTVHASLADFDLAFKAYDSYVEIITRGKDRAEKSGEQDGGIDDDNVVLRTSAQAIRNLCRFGSRKEAEKALEIGETIGKWLEQSEHVNSTASAKTIVEPRSLAIAYCAIGISFAQWARFTYEADARAGIRAKAVSYLQKSLAPKLQDTNSLEALYALALVLAETRDILGSIKVVKKALSPATKDKNASSVDGVINPGYATEYGRERKLIPFWHLLALLLTARSEFSQAEQACEAAFEQFGDPTVLFGKEDAQTFRSEHLNDVNGKAERNLGIVDQMERFEKSAILEIKMTQLALVEVVDGSTAAVDGCDELLALYARLFGDPATEKVPTKPATTSHMVPPKSAAGTIRGSIFRSKVPAKSPPKNSVVRSPSVGSSKASAAATQTSHAPTIQVTDENTNGGAKEHHHHHILPHRHHDDHSGVQRSPSKLKKKSAASLRRRSDVDGQHEVEVPDLPDAVASGSPARNNTVRSKSARRSSVASSNRKSVESTDRPLRPVAHNMSQHAAPPPAGHAHQPPKLDSRLPAPFPNANYIPPEPYFSKIQERRHKVSLLASIWLFICGLYTRAEMHDDANDAVTEAHKLVESFEAEVAHDSSTSKAFADRGWGGGKSVEHLWADVYAARGDLLLSQDLKHPARSAYERAVLHSPDHPSAIVGLANILLDIYCEVIPLEPGAEALGLPTPLAPAHLSDEAVVPHLLTAHRPSAENQLSPPELNRLAARDRAFGLLSSLTKRGEGWDYAEAWFALGRAYEESGLVEKMRGVLWWCVELEDTRPVRGWRRVGEGGFVL